MKRILNNLKYWKLFGPTVISSSRSFEKLHFVVVKTAYLHTNHKEIEFQLANQVNKKKIILPSISHIMIKASKRFLNEILSETKLSSSINSKHQLTSLKDTFLSDFEELIPCLHAFLKEISIIKFFSLFVANTGLIIRHSDYPKRDDLSSNQSCYLCLDWKLLY